jgi:hypothetical protein
VLKKECIEEFHLLGHNGLHGVTLMTPAVKNSDPADCIVLWLSARARHEEREKKC